MFLAGTPLGAGGKAWQQGSYQAHYLTSVGQEIPDWLVCSYAPIKSWFIVLGAGDSTLGLWFLFLNLSRFSQLM